MRPTRTTVVACVAAALLGGCQSRLTQGIKPASTTGAGAPAATSAPADAAAPSGDAGKTWKIRAEAAQALRRAENGHARGEENGHARHAKNGHERRAENGHAWHAENGHARGKAVSRTTVSRAVRTSAPGPRGRTSWW